MYEILIALTFASSFFVICFLFYRLSSAKNKLEEYKTAVWILTGRLKRHRKLAKEFDGVDVVENYIKDIFETMLAYIPDSEKQELKTLFYAEK